jgi:putative SOS response-associated peptidase YedK
MCGRFTLGKEPNSLLDYFHLHGEVPVYHLSYNIAPSQTAPVILHDAQQQRVCQLMQWGLIPSWSKGPAPRFKMINAKAETVHEKPAYRNAFRHRRCLIPCDGFYEWQAREGGKQPFYIYKQDHGLLALAGLWERWQGEAQTIDSFTIITTNANPLMQAVHERMPVIMLEDEFDRWLDSAHQDIAQLRGLLKPYTQDDLRIHPVSSAVNSPKQDSPELTRAMT